MCGKEGGGAHTAIASPPQKKTKDVFGLHVNRTALTARCAKPLVFLRVNSQSAPSSEEISALPPHPPLPHFSTTTPQPLGVEERRAAAAVGGGTDMTHVEERGSFVIPSVFFLETSVNNLLGVQSALPHPPLPSMLKTTRQGGKKEHKSLMRGEEKRGARLASLISEES